MTSAEYPNMDPAAVASADLVIAGSPVYYYDVPANLKTWVRALPGMEGIPCAAYVTFGGEGGNQHNTACTLLELLADKGGMPVGLETFGNMSTFAITWSTGNAKRVLKYSHLPDENSYARMRAFASHALWRARERKPFASDKEIDFRGLIKSTPSIWSTKLCITRHAIDAEKCIECGTCINKCPVDDIDLPARRVDTDRCIACRGCVNNCPTPAMNMTFLEKEVYGYTEFVRRNGIQVPLPEELKAD